MTRTKIDKYPTGTKLRISIPLHHYIDADVTVIRRDDVYGPMYYVKIDKVLGQGKSYAEGDELRLTRATLSRNSKPLTEEKQNDD